MNGPKNFKICPLYAMLKSNMKTPHFLCSAFAIFCLTLPAWGENPSESLNLENRIRELEKRIAISSVRESDEDNVMRSFLSDNIRFGGFFEPVFLTDWGIDSPSRSGLIQNTLGVNLAASIATRTRFITQFVMNSKNNSINPHNDPRAATFGLTQKRSYGTQDFGVQVAQGYLEYRAQDIFYIHGGNGYAPFGIAAQTREPVLFARQGGPELLRTEGLINRSWSGVHIQGFKGIGESMWGYHLYTTSSQPKPMLPGVGTRFWLGIKDEVATFGVSSQMGQNVRGYQTVGADARLNFDWFTLYAEYAKAHYAHNLDPFSFYVEPNFDLWDQYILLYSSFDFESSPQNKTSTLNDPYQRIQYGLGINWLPTSLIRLRTGVNYSDYTQNYRNFMSVNVSAGISF